VFGRLAQEALQPAAQISGLADVWFRLRIVSAKQKHGWSGRDSSEDCGVTGRDELQAVGEHEAIID
jgi:hypothetical protein